jgi:hypothetical protein
MLSFHFYGSSDYVVNLNILMPVRNVIFLEQSRLVFGPWKLLSFLVLSLCIDKIFRGDFEHMDDIIMDFGCGNR